MLETTKATVAKARALRRTMTLPEGLLWRELRKRPGELKFRRQHPCGSFILDFYCESARLGIEVDGMAHDLGNRPQRDLIRDAWLAEQGLRVLRIPAPQILAQLDDVMQLILAECEPLQPTAGPPPLQGGI